MKDALQCPSHFKAYENYFRIGAAINGRMPQDPAYIALICQASRKHAALQMGISTRGAIFLMRSAQACALLAGRDYVIPEDVQKMAAPVLAHRIQLSPEARMRNMTSERALSGIMSSVQVPVKV